MFRLHRSTLASLSAAAILTLPLAAHAQQPLPGPPRAATIASAGGFYVWADGSWQSVALPTFDLGVRLSKGISDLGPAHSFDKRIDGWGVSGALGYIFPHGTFPAAFGSNVRIEIGGSYVEANASQIQSGTFGPLAFVLLSGSPVFILCGAPSCNLQSTLATDHAAWQFNVKGASDYQIGAFTLTPSVTLFSGKARTQQDLFQVVSGGGTTENYTASSLLHWLDLGAKFGLESKTDLTPWLSVGLGGNVGFAYRDVMLSANDQRVRIVGPAVDQISFLNREDQTTAFLANAEARVTVRPSPTIAITGFAGLNYDSNVPGISAAGWSGSAITPSSIPANIKFEDSVSYYAGGALTIRDHTGLLSASPRSTVSFADRFYLRADGSWQSVALPTFDLGVRLTNGVSDLGPAHSFDKRIDGFGVSGALGYVFPHGTVAAVFGSNVRIEVGGSDVEADASQIQSGTFSPQLAYVPLTGASGPFILCSGPSCNLQSTLKTDHAAWQLNVKGASDHQIGAFTLTPSVTVFSGKAHTQQDLFQVTSGGGITENYTVNSLLHWLDLGLKLGLEGKTDLAPWLSVGLGGNVGFAYRDVMWFANDQRVRIVGPAVVQTSFIHREDDTVAFLANAEARVTVRPSPAIAITGFAGLNYDSDVPGIAAAGWSGAASPTAARTPADIKFQDTLSYYAGGAFRVKFGS